MTQQQMITTIEALLKTGEKMEVVIPSKVVFFKFEKMPIELYSELMKHAVFIGSDFGKSEDGFLYDVELTASFNYNYTEFFVK